MGVSTDGILLYGFEPDDEEVLTQFHDFEEFVIEEANLSREDPEYYDKRREAVNSCPIDIVVHCCDNDPLLLVAIRGTVKTAYRGHPEIIDDQHLIVSDEKIQAAKEWCDTHNIPWKEPKWLLASWWG